MIGEFARKSRVIVFFPPVAVQADPILFLGSESQQTSLGIFTTNGASVTSQTAVGTAGSPFNGVGEGAGLTGIVTRALSSGDFDTRTLTGNLISSFTHATPGYLNEDMAGNGIDLWSANSASPTIYKLDPANGNTLDTRTLTGVSQLVGMTFVGSQLWAGDFGAGTIGTIDLTLNKYTPAFSAFSAQTLGGLAYDPLNSVLWVGSFSLLRPYSTGGTILGPDVDTSAIYPGFIDGSAFIENAPANEVPEPGTLLLMGTGVGTFLARRRARRAPKQQL